jgi:hypothetical protein
LLIAKVDKPTYAVRRLADRNALTPPAGKYHQLSCTEDVPFPRLFGDLGWKDWGEKGFPLGRRF